MKAGRYRRRLRYRRLSASIAAVLEAQRERRAFSTIDRLDAPSTVLEPISRLTLRVACHPFAPTCPAVGGCDVLVEVEAIAVLEADVSFVD